ncbi:hypothetical protein COOONC_18386 [Cooperia oncophora]
MAPRCRAVPSIGSTPPQQTQTSTLTSRITTVTITTARVTTHPSETAVSSSTSDQFVIGQFDGVSSQGPQTTVTSSTPGPTPIVTTGPAMQSTMVGIITGQNEDLPTPPTIQEEFPTPSSFPTTTGGGGGSWETVETLFPTPPSTLPER